jgi:UDP-N-acetylglucosamine 2-epimerase (non-hydrolysing)
MGSYSLRQFVTRNPKDPIFFIGTRAELIKVVPVTTRLSQSGISIKVLWAGLHSNNALNQGNFDNLYCHALSKSNHDKDSIVKVLLWFFSSLTTVVICGLSVRASQNRPSIVVVHGDTLCTLIGSLFAKVAGAKLMHIEAGVRSGSLWRPFPEEISRRMVSRFANVHFAPGDRERLNLQSHRGEMINTFHNTSRDALFENTRNIDFDDDGYLVVTLHRTELLSNKRRFSEITQKVISLSGTFSVKWFIGNHERASLGGIGYLDRVEKSGVELCDRIKHEDFIKVFSRAHCVITDSGGLQSECNDLGVPVIVHRNESEYSNPDNSPCVLTKWDLIKIDEFLESLNNNSCPRGISSQVVAGEIIAGRIIEEVNQ